MDIKHFMKKNDLNVKEVARLVYVTTDAVYGWTSGRRNIDQARAELLLWKVEGIEPPKAVFINPNQKTLLEALNESA